MSGRGELVKRYWRMWQASQAEGSRMAKLCDWSAMTWGEMREVKYLE